MSNLAVKEIEFNGDLLVAAQDRDNNKVYVGVKWVAEGIGLSTGQSRRQVTNINEDIVLKNGVANLKLPTNSGTQEVTCIELDYLPLWLAKISITPTMIKDSPETVDRLIEYQLKAKEVLANVFINEITQTIPKTYKEALVSLIDSIEKQEELEKVIVEQKPKVESYDHFMDANNNQNMMEAAKVLGIGRNKLLNFLRNRKVLMSDNVPYQRFIDMGYFVVKGVTSTGTNVVQTFVTPKGIDYVGKLIRKNNIVPFSIDN